MKHPPFLKNINSLVSSFSESDSLVIKGFHPDFFLSLLHALNRRVIVFLPDLAGFQIF